MSSFFSSDNVLVALLNNRTMRIPVQLQEIKKTIDTTTLIDFSTTGNFINPHLLPLRIFQLSKVPLPITAYNVDRTPNNKRAILWTSVISFSSRSFSNMVKFMVICLFHPQIILGMSWLHKWNPKIDWKNFTIDFCTKNSPVIPDLQGVERTLHEHPPSNRSTNKHLDKLTISTEITQAEKPKEVSIPQFCADFTDVFSKKTYEQLSPHHPFDHTIDLKTPSFPRLLRSTCLTLPRRMLVKPLSKNTLKPVALSPPNPHKLPYSSLSQRKMESFVPGKTTGI